MKSSLFKGEFLCPECGSLHAEPEPPQNAQQPGNRIRWRRTCASCQLEIPVHLAERWGGISVEDARKEWREVYRDASKDTGSTRGLLNQTISHRRDRTVSR